MMLIDRITVSPGTLVLGFYFFAACFSTISAGQSEEVRPDLASSVATPTSEEFEQIDEKTDIPADPAIAPSIEQPDRVSPLGSVLHSIGSQF
jgi:hypothetical protein